PIWLDEGIAEFFEVGLGKGGFNAPHAVHLKRLWKNRMWRPDLKKLETLRLAKEMGQTEYAESWLWIHFLITNGFESQQLLRNYLDQMDGVHSPGSFAEMLQDFYPDPNRLLVEHLELILQ
ncbi:MAG: hypothetical protein AAF623_12820, partial [Planctomycetota bacterium]